MPLAREKEVATSHPQLLLPFFLCFPGEEPEQPCLHAGRSGLVPFWFLKQVAYHACCPCLVQEGSRLRAHTW